MPTPKRNKRMTMAKQTYWQNRVANLRAKGWQLQDIANRLGISLSTVHRILREVKAQAKK